MAEHYKVQLGRAIAERRKELGLTQKELAEATHYKEAQSVSRWERGENLPTDLDVVARALDWSLADLTRGIEAPNGRVARQLGVVPPTQTPDPFHDPTPLTKLIELVSRLDEQVRLLRTELAERDAEVQRRLDEGFGPS